MFLIELWFNFKINIFFKKHARRIVLYNYKKRYICKNVDNIVVSEFRYKKNFDLIKLFKVVIRSKILLYNIVLFFRLFIDLRIKSDENFFNDF